MNGYFYTLLVASVCGALCSMLTWGGYEKYIKYICSLICICLMILPFREIDFALEDFDAEAVTTPSNPDDGLYTLSTELTEVRIGEYIDEIVFSQFGIKPKGSYIKIDWTLKEPIIESITVAFSNEDMHLADKAGAYLSSALGGEVKIIEE